MSSGDPGSTPETDACHAPLLCALSDEALNHVLTIPLPVKKGGTAWEPATADTVKTKGKEAGLSPRERARVLTELLRLQRPDLASEWAQEGEQQGEEQEEEGEEAEDGQDSLRARCLWRLRMYLGDAQVDVRGPEGLRAAVQTYGAPLALLMGGDEGLIADDLLQGVGGAEDAWGGGAGRRRRGACRAACRLLRGRVDAATVRVALGAAPDLRPEIVARWLHEGRSAAVPDDAPAPPPGLLTRVLRGLPRLACMRVLPSLPESAWLETLRFLTLQEAAGSGGASTAAPLPLPPAPPPHLLRLSLRGCIGVHDALAPLAALTSLQQLDVAGCAQVCALSALASLPNLRHLTLSDTAVRDLCPLSHLPLLLHLDLTSCTAVHDLSPLASCPALQRLVLRDCPCVLSLAPLAHCSRLAMLDVSDSLRSAPEEGLRQERFELLYHQAPLDLLPLSSCLELTWLDLMGRRVETLAPLRPCRRLKFLFLTTYNQKLDTSFLPDQLVLNALAFELAEG